MYICDESDAVIFEPICRCSTAKLGDITAYYCPRCGAESGNPGERSRDRERKRDNAERCRRYNEMHREERAAYARRRRQENPGLVAADNAYYKKKRRLAEKEAR